MGRKSVNPNKSVYQLVREELELTREQAADLMPAMSPQHIEKIENGRINIDPMDVLIMAQGYKRPQLCNYYCANECPIGQKSTPEVQVKGLGQIAIETLNALNKLQKEKNRLLEIVEDGTITPDEYQDFKTIKATLDKLAMSVDSMKLWLDQAMADGKVDPKICQ